MRNKKLLLAICLFLFVLLIIFVTKNTEQKNRQSSKPTKLDSSVETSSPSTSIAPYDIGPILKKWKDLSTVSTSLFHYPYRGFRMQPDGFNGSIQKRKGSISYVHWFSLQEKTLSETEEIKNLQAEYEKTCSENQEFLDRTKLRCGISLSEITKMTVNGRTYTIIPHYFIEEGGGKVLLAITKTNNGWIHFSLNSSFGTPDNEAITTGYLRDLLSKIDLRIF